MGQRKREKERRPQAPFGPSVASLCHPWFTTTNLSYRFPIFETSATALCGTTGRMIQYVHWFPLQWVNELARERLQALVQDKLKKLSTRAHRMRQRWISRYQQGHSLDSSQWRQCFLSMSWQYLTGRFFRNQLLFRLQPTRRMTRLGPNLLASLQWVYNCLLRFTGLNRVHNWLKSASWCVMLLIVFPELHKLTVSGSPGIMHLEHARP